MKNIINQKYVHFAILVSSGKIVDAWEQSEDIKFWSKIDLKDNFPDNKLSDFKVYSKKYLLSYGVNPFARESWQ